MKRHLLFLGLFFLILFPFYFVQHVAAEGTREIYPVGWGYYKFYLSHAAIRNDFALYGCAETDRLNIEIVNDGEMILFGFNDGPVTNNFYFRKRVHQ